MFKPAMGEAGRGGEVVQLGERGEALYLGDEGGKGADGFRYEGEGGGRVGGEGEGDLETWKAEVQDASRERDDAGGGPEARSGTGDGR